MAAIAVLGGHTFDADELSLVSVAKQSVYSQRGKRIQRQVVMQCEGELLGANSDAIITKIQQIENALKDDSKEFRFSVGGTLAHAMLLNECVSGIKVIQQAFPKHQDGELATVRTFSFTLQGTYDAVEDDLVYWEESIEQVGDGGPRFYVLETAESIPQAIFTSNYTAVTYHQAGRAIGYASYPAPPGPVIPSGELRPARRVRRTSGRNLGSAIRFYGRSWSYTMFNDPETFGASDPIPTSK